METKELKIQIPEGYEIDKENSTFEKIVFKKKEISEPKRMSRSWEEYCKNNEDKQVWFIKEDSNIGRCHLMCRPINEDKNTLPSKELAEAFRAMMQLVSLRHDWIHRWSIDSGMADDWEPDWNSEDDKWYPSTYCDGITLCVSGQFSHFSHSLTFPTKEMAENFMNHFKNLLEIAKPLI